MNFTAVNTTEVVLAYLAFMGKKAVDCGAGGSCLLRTLEVATGEERVRQRLIVRLLRKESILPEAIAASSATATTSNSPQMTMCSSMATFT